MRTRTPAQATPLIKFETLSLAMFSQLKFSKASGLLCSMVDEANRNTAPQPQPANGLKFVDELPHTDH
jgi:hypothetical protein